MDLVQEESDQAGAQDVVRYDFSPVPLRFLGAIYPTLEAYIGFAAIRVDHP